MEILNEIVEGQEKLNKRLSQLELQNKELKTMFEQQLKQKPVIQNKVSLDAKTVSEHILPKLKAGIDTTKIEALSNDLIQKINNSTSRIPQSIRVQGEFYGFTSLSPFIAYFSTFLLMAVLSFGYVEYFRNKILEDDSKWKNAARDEVYHYRKQHPNDSKNYEQTEGVITIK